MVKSNEHAAHHPFHKGLPSVGGPKQLAWLANTNQLILANTAKVVEELCSCETRNVYMVRSRLDPNTCACCGHCRRYEFTITDQKKELVTFLHPTDCCACLHKIEVVLPPKTIIGTITEDFTLCFPKYTIRIPENIKHANIQGPCFPCLACCCTPMAFKVMLGTQIIGRIGKGVIGLDRRFTNRGYVSIIFPRELDVRSKVLFLGAAFLINFMYYYRKSTRKDFYLVDVST